MFNGASEVRNPATSNAYYAANTLFKVESKDEDQKTMYTYSDLLGRKIMEDHAGVKTYYMYDNSGNITKVIQPEASKLLHQTPSYTHTTSAVLKHSFVYTYNSRYLLATKKIPGTVNPYYYKYDRLDRLVLTVNPKSFKAFTKYDILSRPVLTGKYDITGTAPDPTGTESLYELKNSSAAGYYYTQNLAYPKVSTEVYSVNYYDDYDFDQNYTDNYSYQTPSGDAANYPTAAYMFARGMPTGMKTRVLSTSGPAPNLFHNIFHFYDKYGREIFTRSENIYSGTDLRWNNYHFAGWVLNTRLQHTATINSSNKNYILNERFTYDHAGRQGSHYHKIGDSGAEQLLSQQVYNEKGELSSKILASNQSLDYLYNIRGWLTDINDANSCSGSDLFSLKINYTEANNELSSGSYFNGNISTIAWRVGINCIVNGVTRLKSAYGFTYDNQNRLTRAIYGEYTTTNSLISSTLNRYSVDPVAYDANGNITNLTRRGKTGTSTYGVIDNLTYNYSASTAYGGNRLDGITEASDITKGFKKVSAGAAGYSYDNNGNAYIDGYKGITGITYNYLNLPAKISYGSSKYIEYTYDASGSKWKKTVVDNNIVIAEKYYLGPIEYNGSNLEAIYHSEGRAVPSGSNYEYQFVIRDHLGNSRVLFKMAGSAPVILQDNHYYPFGMEMEGNFVGGGGSSYLFNGMEREKTFELNCDMAFFRSYDPAVGRWMQVDPKYNHSISTYSGFGNNPMILSDALGDTTRLYNTEGELAYTINDGYENQEHFFKDNLLLKAFSEIGGIGGNEEFINKLGKAARKSSDYYIGANTRGDLADLASRGESEGAEAYGVLVYSHLERELRVDDSASDQLGITNDEKCTNCRHPRKVDFTYAVARGIINSAEQNGKKVAFDVHSHGSYSVRYLGGEGALTPFNLSLHYLGKPSNDDRYGSSVQSVGQFNQALISTNKGYTIYRQYGPISRSYDFNGNLRLIK